MKRLFDPPQASNRSQLERLDRMLTYKYRDHGTAATFRLESNRPQAPHAQEPMFDAPQVMAPSQKESLL